MVPFDSLDSLFALFLGMGRAAKQEPPPKELHPTVEQPVDHLNTFSFPKEWGETTTVSLVFVGEFGV